MARQTGTLAQRVQARTAQVEQTDSGEPAAQVSVAKYVRTVIDRQSERIHAVMPQGIDADRFSQLVLTAVKASPDLMKCFETQQGELSVLLAVMQAAVVGLEPNTPTQDAWILPRRNGQVQEAQLTIGYRGYIRLARRSGEIKALFAEVVREGDHFRYGRGLDDDVFEWTPGEKRGELTHTFAIVRYVSGGNDFRVLTRQDVEARRARSDSWKSETGRKFSPWTTSEEAMWRKSAIRALAPWLPLTAEARKVMDADERTLTLSADSIDADIVPVGYELEQGDEQPPPGVDAETGEVEVVDEPAAPPAAAEPAQPTHDVEG